MELVLRGEGGLGQRAEKERSILTEQEMLSEIIIMGLRIAEGIDIKKIKSEHSLDVTKARRKTRFL
jgi:coproporphyrinogen III oxidase-like Fe-S oxidoreductase